MKVILKSKTKKHFATGEFDGAGIVVHKGSRINVVDSYPRMPQKVRILRHDKEYVTEDGEVIRDVPFSSLSAAAVFVTGRSSNGFIAWRVDDKYSIKEYFRKENSQG